MKSYRDGKELAERRKSLLLEKKIES